MDVMGLLLDDSPPVSKEIVELISVVVDRRCMSSARALV